MISGREALGSIDAAVRRAQQEAAVIDRDIAGLNEQRLWLREQEGQACRELALFRLKRATGGRMISALTAAEDRARTLMKVRADAIEAVNVRLAHLEAESARLEENHRVALAEAEKRRREYAAAEESVLARLTQTREYREQARRTEGAERVARHAEDKTRRAEADRELKGKPYRDDPLFMYLWRCGYGTAEYDRGFIARFFDRRVARLIGFDGARANYAMLLEIPRRLREHAERQRGLADDEAQALEDMEEAALMDSEAAAPAARLAEAEEAAAEAERQLENVEKRTADLMEERARLSSGEDAETRAAIVDIADQLRHADIRDLRESARATPLPDDDHIVERIAALEAEEDSVDRELRDSRHRQLEQQRRLRELESIRREYRQRGYGTASWDFGDSDILSVLLAQLIGGALSRDGFWGHMNRRRMPGPWCGDWGRRRRTRPAGGWGRSRAPAPRPPRKVSGGGGFRTTGSF